MVNVDRLLELLGDNYLLTSLGFICRAEKNGNRRIWNRDELTEVQSMEQLLGRCSSELDLKIYDEIYSRLNNSVFTVDIKRVEENLAKLGLPYRGADEKGNVQIFFKIYIRKYDLKYVERMEYIPVFNGEHSNGMELYNQVLRASKNWGGGE